MSGFIFSKYFRLATFYSVIVKVDGHVLQISRRLTISKTAKFRNSQTQPVNVWLYRFDKRFLRTIDKSCIVEMLLTFPYGMVSRLLSKSNERVLININNVMGEVLSFHGFLRKSPSPYQILPGLPK